MEAFNSRDLIIIFLTSCVTFPDKLVHENLVLDQDNNYLISLSILTTCQLDYVWILLGEVICKSLVGLKRERSYSAIFDLR